MIKDTTNRVTTMEDGAPETETIAGRVRQRYADAARRVQAGEGTCCADDCCTQSDDPVTGNLYDAAQTQGLPEHAVLASLGCGNPTALIDLREGQTVLDLGSGGGIDVLLSARRVGPAGFVYGLDFTDEMLALAMANKARAGAANVAFLKGRIEEIPLPARAVDVVISNCIINLAADKGQVLREAYRVLVPGGVSRSATWWPRARCPRLCALIWKPGLGASPVRLRSTRIKRSSPTRVLWTSAWRLRGATWPPRQAWTWPRCPPVGATGTANLPALLSAPPSPSRDRNSYSPRHRRN